MTKGSYWQDMYLHFAFTTRPRAWGFGIEKEFIAWLRGGDDQNALMSREGYLSVFTQQSDGSTQEQNFYTANPLANA